VAARTAASAPSGEAVETPILTALATLNPDEMSPRQAIEALYALKAKAAETAAPKPVPSLPRPAGRS
jgi:DNA mismatch repair protein MutS